MDLSALNKASAMLKGQLSGKSEDSAEQSLPGERVLELKVADISPDPQQPRKSFDPQLIKELAEDIKQNGLIQPIIVRQDGLGHYVVVAGERRLKAVQSNGGQTIRAILSQDYAQEQLGYIQVAENSKRSDLKYYELADFIISRIDGGEKQSTVADKLGMSKQDVNKYLAWKDAPDYLKTPANADKLGSIRTFYDLVKLAEEHGDEVKSFVEDAERIGRSDVTNLKNRLEKGGSEDEPGGSEDDAAQSGDEDELSGIGDNSGSAGQGDEGTAAESSGDESSGAEQFDVGSSTIDENVGAEESSDSTGSDAGDDFGGESGSADKFKKPVIFGSVDSREAELLYKKKPSTDGMLCIKWEDGSEDEVEAGRFEINRITEA